MIVVDRRKNIQQWVGADITEAVLGQILRLNDRMHAALSNWHAVTTEFAEARSRVQVCQDFCLKVVLLMNCYFEHVYPWNT